MGLLDLLKGNKHENKPKTAFYSRPTDSPSSNTVQGKPKPTYISKAKPTGSQQVYIDSAIHDVQMHYKQVASTTRVDWFIEEYKSTYSSLNYLLDAEKKFPSYFGKNNPTSNLNKINCERPKMEKKFIDRYILSIEKKLLEYSTERGKRNNFNKETDKFRYYADEFLPESVVYFDKLISERFPDYI